MQMNVLLQPLRKRLTWNSLLLMMFQLNVRSYLPAFCPHLHLHKYPGTDDRSTLR